MGKMCLLSAYFAKSLFSEHQIDVVTRIKFLKHPKSTKVHKKAPPGMPEALEDGELFCFVTLPPLLAGLQDIGLQALPGGCCIRADLCAVLFCGAHCDAIPTFVIFDISFNLRG